MKAKTQFNKIVIILVILTIIPLLQSVYAAAKTPVAAPAATPTIKAPAPAPDPVDIILVLDNSASMKTNDPERLTIRFVSEFVDKIPDGSRLGIIVFDDKINFTMPMTDSSAPDFNQSIEASLKKVDYRGQWTKSADAIERAIYELKNSGRKDIQKIILLITDGIIDSGDKTRDAEKKSWLEGDLASDAGSHGIHIFGIAFTEAADFELIQKLARKTGGEYYRAFTPREMQGVFNKIRDRMTLPKPTPTAVPRDLSMRKIITAPFTHQTEPEPIQDKLFIHSYYIIALIGIAILLILILLVRPAKRSGSNREAVVESSGEESRPMQMPRAFLRDLNDIMPWVDYELTKPVTRIGRLPEVNDIVINKKTISKQHARIEFKDQFFTVVDLRSSNGTSVNQNLFSSISDIRRMPLKSGDTIKFDEYKFLFSIKNGKRIESTVLRPVVSDEQESEDVEQALRETDPLKIPYGVMKLPAIDDESPGSVGTPPAKKKGQRLSTRCWNHPDRPAPRICSVCLRDFCMECVTEKDGKVICKECLEEED